MLLAEVSSPPASDNSVQEIGDAITYVKDGFINRFAYVGDEYSNADTTSDKYARTNRFALHRKNKVKLSAVAVRIARS